MQMRFGTTNSASTCRVFLINICMHLLIIADLYFVHQFAVCDRPNFEYELGNSTFSLRHVFTCSPYNAECLCSFSLLRTKPSSNCYHKTYGRYGPVVIQLTFLTSIYLIRELFAFSGKLSRSFMYLMCTICFIIFIGLVIGSFVNSCFHRTYVTLLHLMCIIPGLMGIHDSLSHGLCDVTPRNRIVCDSSPIRIEQHENQVRAWHDIV